ncbi:hypothetical protein DY000_02050134 [Brassica cretica]|uniref:Uncharacterized protein n=1 Tax=Brassica cretica TaxID=69181 RepID=A0ABQ7ET36_BRACR|nr:hypothetical protein DY000_02050134 [Brassica cretica]
MTNRAGSRRRVDSPVSRSDSSLDPGMGSEYDLAAPLPYAYASPPSIGPASSVSEDDLVEWRRKYSFSSSTILRIPAPEERASSFIPGQIAIYEAFFDIGFRGVIPALVASLCDFFKISPSQLNPPSWRLLVAIQNLGDLENLSFGINEVLFSYHLAPLNGNEGRLHLRPRSGLPIMEELQKGDRKGSAFSKKWQERYIFVMLSGHSYHWNFIAGTHPVLPEGEDTVVRARQLPLDRRQVPFLLSDSNMSGNTSNDPFAAYQEAAKVMSAKKGSASRTVSGGDLVITVSRRAATVKIEPSALVFPQDGTILSSGEPSEAVQVLQGGLLRTISQLFHFGERLSIESSLVSQEELDDLKRQVSEEKAQRVAHEMEICDLKDKLKDIERTAEIASADTLSIGKKNQELEEAIETLRLEVVMAVNGARVTTRWELMREWLQKKNLHLLTACLSFVFGIFRFVDDIRVASVISNNLSEDLGRKGSRCHDRRRTFGSGRLSFLGTLGPCNDHTSWVSYDWISSGDPGVSWRILISLEPGGRFLGNPWVLDPEVLSWTHDPGIKVLKGPQSATLGEATLSTCWGIAFYRWKAGHYRVPVLHVAFCRKPLSDLEDAGVGENPDPFLPYVSYPFCFFVVVPLVIKGWPGSKESSDKSSRRIVTQRPNACSARSLRSNRVRAKAQSLHSDQIPIPLGRYVATELEPELGRYVATELEPELGRYVATELEPELGRYVATELKPKFGRYVATELYRNVDTTSLYAFSSTLRCYLPNTVANPSHVPRHF